MLKALKKKRIDWSARGFSISIDRSYWLYIGTPAFRFGVDHFRQQYKAGFSRGRCQQRQLHIPISADWQIKIEGRGKTYLELVDGPAYLRNTDWLLDEFDSSFNDLAAASLRYHMDHAVTYCSDERRAEYQDLIDRLTTRERFITDEELEILHPEGSSFEDDLRRINEEDPVRDAIYAKAREREQAHHDRIRQARHDFVDIMPGLWS